MFYKDRLQPRVHKRVAELLDAVERLISAIDEEEADGKIIAIGYLMGIAKKLTDSQELFQDVDDLRNFVHEVLEEDVFDGKYH